jgi:hypothetical protein
LVLLTIFLFTKIYGRRLPSASRQVFDIRSFQWFLTRQNHTIF